MGKKQPIHRTTRFDFDCEAKLEYDKKYGRNLSYGYYSLYKETGRLPLEWLIRLVDLEKAIPKNFTLASMEHQEYKRRYHKKIGFKEYVENKKAKKLSNEWLKYLEESKKWIPKDFRAAYTEYNEYCQTFQNDITFFEYYEKKDKGLLKPLEWYHFLIEIEKSIIELQKSYFYTGP